MRPATPSPTTRRRENPYVVELGIGGMETAETHSMSMEFFAWPYMEHFFGDDAQRYRYMHLLDALSFLPYGTIVDDFQRQVYENPDWTPRSARPLGGPWRRIFVPTLPSTASPIWRRGPAGSTRLHIYETPFYYIDYCLAQTAALQFLLESQKDYDDAFRRYVHFLSQGGEKVFTDLLQEGRPAFPPSRKGRCARWPRRARPFCGNYSPTLRKKHNPSIGTRPLAIRPVALRLKGEETTSAHFDWVNSLREMGILFAICFGFDTIKLP